MVRRFGLDPVLESRTRSISWASVSPERLHQPQARAGTRAEKPPAGREDHVTIGLGVACVFGRGNHDWWLDAIRLGLFSILAKRG